MIRKALRRVASRLSAAQDVADLLVAYDRDVNGDRRRFPLRTADDYLAAEGREHARRCRSARMCGVLESVAGHLTELA